MIDPRRWCQTTPSPRFISAANREVVFMRRYGVLALSATIFGVALCGCSGDTRGVADNASAEQRNQLAKDSNVHPNNAPSSTATVVTEVPQDVNVGNGKGFRVRPKNPNDKKFQMDPKLAGGG
jgi:hypothetical protein